jgi:hypothetical protein
MFQKPIIPLAIGSLLALATAATAAPDGECDGRETVAKYGTCMLERYPIARADLRPSGLVAISHTTAMKDRPWYAEWFIAKWDRHELVAVHDTVDPIGPTVVDGEEIVDESGEEEDDDDGWDWLRIIIALILGASEHADDIVYNSVYDGEVYSPSNNSSAIAVLQLRRLGSDVNATLWTDNGLIADTSWLFVCPDVDVPAGVFPFAATMDPPLPPPSPNAPPPLQLRSTGSVSKPISLAGIGAGSVVASFSLEVMADLEHLVADIALTTPTGCSDTALTGTFVRRIGSQYQ